MIRFAVLRGTALIVFATSCGGTVAVPASTTPDPASAPAGSIAARTQGLVHHDGFIPVHLDTRQGKILLELPGDSTRVLFFLSLATGLGSNPIGLDRGADGASHVLRFDRNGERVLAVLENWSYRGAADNPDHRRTIAESFPPSTVASLPVLTEERGRLLVDATDFFIRDWLDIAGTLQGSGQGSYSLARDRSSPYAALTRAFPGNTEVDVALTFAASGAPGRIVSSIVPDGRAFTLRQHASLLPLPDGNYRPREMDPRVGYFGITFNDYAQPLNRPLARSWAARHRLERVNPADPRSPFRNPIVYYIDRGIPEPIRSATLAGAKFWEEAFDQAGLAGGFRAELLPEGADPMDARYDVVQWENRNERGWSIGGSLGDPRTGEILKGMARMDSHRARTAYNLYAALMGAEPSPAETAFVLGRVRQVTAHEIGHTLGMAHNYIASTYERGSLMDYPPPRVRLTADGSLDVGSVYDVGPGEYDVWAVRWGYGIFPPESEADSLRAIVADGLRRGFLFLADADARPEFASDPRTNLWDDASTPAEFLAHQLAVRRVALVRFGERNIRPGDPVATLQERLVPLYFFHRFAVNALAKSIGGMEYHFALRGDGLQATRPLAGDVQRRALSALLATLQPAELAIPDTVVTLLAPRPFGIAGGPDLFASQARPVFDELAAARTLAQSIIDPMLQRDRAARLVLFASRDDDALQLGELIDSLVTATWRRESAAERGRGREARKLRALRRVTRRAVADQLMQLAADSAAAPDVRAVVDLRLATLRDEARTRGRAASDETDRASWRAIADDLTRWLERQQLPSPTPAPRLPLLEPFG